MKRRIIAAALALLMLITPVSANALSISVSQGQAQQGETVLVEVRLTEVLTTKSGSISLQYDHDVLSVESYTWHLEGALIQFFDPATGQGVFACMQPIQIGDLIFSVTFQVAENAEYGRQNVSVGMEFTNNEDPDDNAKVENVPGDIIVSCDNHQIEGATCTEPGTCAVCGAVAGDPLGHSWKDATCTAPKTCKTCGATEGSALGHSYGDVTVHQPTPEAQGYSEHTCGTCGFTEQFDFVQFCGFSVGGTVTSYLADSDVTVELISAGKVVRSVCFNGQAVAYSLDDVPVGTYTLRFSKDNHVAREYEIEVGTENVTLDAQIFPKGDVTGDGSVNIKDFQRLLRHVNKTNLLSDYVLTCGDVTGDGVCNIKDFQRLLRHVNKTNPLF